MFAEALMIVGIIIVVGTMIFSRLLDIHVKLNEIKGLMEKEMSLNEQRRRVK